MKATVEIDAGICGFHTTACANSEDGQHVSFDVKSDCANIAKVGVLLRDLGEVDAWQEISPKCESRLMAAFRSVLRGCCAGCAVPAGVFKGMQVAAGLALPKDVHAVITKE